MWITQSKRGAEVAIAPSLRLYHEQGINAQALAGHKSADMTAVYRDVRGDEWVKVAEMA